MERLSRSLHSDRGSAAVPFIFSLPIFLLILAILVQYALIVNAKLLISHAANTAARAAVTSLAEGHPENVSSAAYLSLAPVSPLATTAVHPQADLVYRAMENSGIAVAESFPARYTYAMEAARVDWSPHQDDFTTSTGQPLEVTVSYRFHLTVPAAMRLIGLADTVAGVHGRFLNISSTSRVQTSHGRQVAADDEGWPQ